MLVAGMAHLAECTVIGVVGDRLSSYTFLPNLWRGQGSERAGIQAREGHVRPGSILRNSFSGIQMDLTHRKTR